MEIRSIRMLRHFAEACRTGNLHQAAKARSLTQSAITKSIQQLEDDLGVRLFDRTTRGVTRTTFGQALYARVRRIEAECDLIEKEISEMAAGHAGRLTIGAGSVWSSMFLPRVLSRLHGDRPSAEFTVVRSSGARFVEQFERGEIDVGLGALDSFINYAGELPDDFVCEPLSEISTAFFAHRDHPLHRLPCATPEDLRGFPSAVFRVDQELQGRIGAYFMLRGLKQPHPALISDSISGVMETLKVSTMITCLPSPLGQIAASFDVLPIRTQESPWTFTSGILYRKSGAAYPLLDELIKALRSESTEVPLC